MQLWSPKGLKLQTPRLPVYIVNGVVSLGIASGFLLPFITHKGIGDWTECDAPQMMRPP